MCLKSQSNDETMFLEYRKNPSLDLRNRIVDKYIYLADLLAKKFLNRGVEYEDIYQVACLALIKAVERFDPSKGVKFVSFATPTIIGEIKRYFRDKRPAIRVPRRVYEIYRKVNDTREKLFHEMKRAPRVDELAARLNMTEEEVLEVIESFNVYNMQSFDQGTYGGTNDDDVGLHEIMGGEDRNFERIENRDFLKRGLERLNEEEKEFVLMRYFDRKTQKEIAAKLGVSQMYVSRFERRLLNKFRRMLENK